MKILVTGSRGNIGSKLVPFLKSKGHTVFEIDIIQATGPLYRVVDINQAIDLAFAFEWFRPDVVYHLAAMVSRVTCEDSPGITIQTNLTGLNNVIQCCKNFKSKLIYFSTSEVYGNIGGLLCEDRECQPNNLYGLTKYLGEKIVRYCLTDYVIVRPFMFYDEDETQGDHRSAMIRFCYHLKRGEKIEVHKGSSRSWMHISDGVRVLEKLLYIRESEIINIGSSELIKTKDLASKICQRLNINYSEFVNETEIPDRMTLMKIPDTKKQFKYTGVQPEINIEQGIELILNKI